MHTLCAQTNILESLLSVVLEEFYCAISKMTDYDKKFEEDLERAQALSLESLALEQFRKKKLQELSKSSSNGQSKKAPTGNQILTLLFNI